MWLKIRNTAAVTAAVGPNPLPMKVTKEPAEGVKRENSASVSARNNTPIMAARMVSGAETPAQYWPGLRKRYGQE